jgi:hypothetical protein
MEDVGDNGFDAGFEGGERREIVEARERHEGGYRGFAAFGVVSEKESSCGAEEMTSIG